MVPSDKRVAPRAPVDLEVRLEFGSIDDFVERYAVNVSRGGIFVRSREPRPPGTHVRLDVQLADGLGVISGTGVVAWTGLPSAPGETDRTPGMGIRFTSLDTESQALVDLIVAGRGGTATRSEPPSPAEVGMDAGAAALAATSAVASPAAPPGLRPSAPEKAPPGQPEGAGKVGAARVVGIDLGTTNSCIAIVEGGKPRVLASKQGYRTVPSVVAFDAQGRLLVGHPAKGQMVVNPRHTVYGSKRLVGRPFQSPTVQACRDRFHYEIVAGEGGEAAVRFAGRDFSLQQVAAFVLKELREMAEQALGEPVTRAVVTVPAYYNDHQRSAVRAAGKLAGLEIDRIVNEPTAAALAFGHGKALEKRILVYDLGGGTFDASVLEIQGEVYEVVSTGGDTFLGGVDFDAQLVDHLAYAFLQAHAVLPPPDPAAWQRLRDAAEETKIALSAAESAVAKVPFLCKGAGGKDLSLDVTVTRAELEALTGQLVERSLEVCLEVLSARGLAPKDVDEVLLVGGQSRMPLVWRRIREVFGREPNHGVHPDEAVAVGAALLADSAARIDAVVLIDVLAMGIGIGLPGGRIATVLPRNTKLPVKKAYEHATTKDGQEALELQIFQGDSGRVADSEYLGTLHVGGLRPRARGEVRVAVEFAVGNEGILEVTARDLSTGRVTEVRFATVETPEALRRKLELPEPQKAPPGARPIEPPRGDEKKGIFGRIFGAKK